MPSIITEFERLSVRCEIGAAIAALAPRNGTAILESAYGNPRFSRYSILADDPVDEFKWLSHSDGDAIEALHEATSRLFGHQSQEVQERLGDYHGVAEPNGPACGWIGYFAYEAGLGRGDAAPVLHRHSPAKLAHLRFYDTMAVYDRLENRWYAAGIDWPRSSAQSGNRPALRDRLRAQETRLRNIAERSIPLGHESSSAPPADIESNMSHEAYCRHVARIKGHIEAGDVYQVNLTQRFAIRSQLSHTEAYMRLRNISQPAHGALLVHDDYAVLSSSPELFLQLDGRRVITRPIKGTRPRTGNPAVDRIHRDELQTCVKERAELVMIVDLMRNDLGRVCRPGSIRVVEAAAIEEHPTVFHQVATIHGHLAEGRGWADLLRATFPPGSVTGAPKIRAMQIIDELEPTPRDVYCGSIGRIGVDGSLSLNVAIRTMIHRRGVFHCYAGGAIVADGVAEREYEEIMTKASGMFRALGAGPQDPAHARDVEVSIS
ncbi:MAG: aminodeoxychorismate synthase component I [Phycisphaerae bacterium]|nr:aminodeoxychorismate synthase component I [Phycisphaerae bacterium]